MQDLEDLESGPPDEFGGRMLMAKKLQHGHKNKRWNRIWKSHMEIEHSPFIDDVPIKTLISRGFPS